MFLTKHLISPCPGPSSTARPSQKGNLIGLCFRAPALSQTAKAHHRCRLLLSGQSKSFMQWHSWKRTARRALSVCTVRYSLSCNDMRLLTSSRIQSVEARFWTQCHSLLTLCRWGAPNRAQIFPFRLFVYRTSFFPFFPFFFFPSSFSL